MDNFTPGSLAGLTLDVPGSHAKAVARPWEVYEVEAHEGKLGSDYFTYLVETGKPAVLSVEDLAEAELFNGSLQAVDVTDTRSVLRFVNKFGLPSSPMYQGTMRLEWFRRRRDAGIRPYVPIPTEDANRAQRMVNPVDTHLVKLDSPESLNAELEDCLKGNMPYVLSERAREIETGNPNVVGAVSMAEVVQTIRALQVATALPEAFSYFSHHGGTGEDLIEYLSVPRYVAQSGPWFFLHVDAPIVGGGRLDVYERRIEASERLRDEFARAEEQGFNTKEGYSIALARGLWKCANDALRFLVESDMSYRSTAFLWADDGAAGMNPFARVLGIRRGQLPDFSLYGSIGEAVIHQYLIVFADEKPFRRCENCGRVFKKYREEGYKKNIRETRFCRRSCNVSFNQKNKAN